MLICEEIGSAIHLIIRSRGANPVMTEIIELYRSSGLNLKVETVTDKKLYRPTIDIVFKKIKKEGVFLLVPVSNALAIVLGNNLKRIPSLAELIELV